MARMLMGSLSINFSISARTWSKSTGGSSSPGRQVMGCLALEHHLLESFRLEAPGRLAHHALEVADHAVGEAEALAPLHDVVRGQVVLHHEDGQVAHHLGGGSDLYDVAQHLVDGACTSP